MTTHTEPTLGEGIYTPSDAARILDIAVPQVRRWVTASTESQIVSGIVPGWKINYARGFNFYALIELYTVANLRRLGISMQKIRKAREELADRFDTKYPFALRGLLSDGRKILYQLDEPDEETTLILDGSGQTEFTQILVQFCERIDFHIQTDMAERYWPLGKTRAVVIDPHHAFGQPRVMGTNIRTEVIYRLLQAGESREDLVHMYNLKLSDVVDAEEYELQAAA